MSNRRDFFKTLGTLGLSTIAAKLSSNEQLNALDSLANTAFEKEAFVLPNLPYEYNALEPFIDEVTMKIHYTKHHKGYVDKLNATPSTNIDYKSTDIDKCRQLDPTMKLNYAMRNNLGGHVNHCLFWELLKPNPNSEKNVPKEKLEAAIIKQFKSVDEFKKQFTETATKHFGSGWCWLVEDGGKLSITTTINQDNPFMRDTVVDKSHKNVLLALDVWEHAYYLKYQNKRADYIANWWNIVNWEKAEQFFEATKK
jgi:superoxide dismutase, Fe-Mn family